MTKEQTLALMKDRMAKLEGSPKCTKCPGVKRKLSRQIRNMEGKTNEQKQKIGGDVYRKQSCG